MDISEKYNAFEKAIDNPISEYNCLLFLEDEEIRDSFIADYSFFLRDSNYDAYVGFILRNLKSSNIDLLSDLFTLSIKIDFFSNQILEKIETILFKNSHHVLKLASFDYLNNFFLNITQDKYISLNEIVKEKSTNKLVVFQALINLMVKDKRKYFPIVLDMLRESEIPSFFYRLTYNLLEFGHIKNIVSKSDLSILKEITFKQDFSKEVIEEIVSDLEL